MKFNILLIILIGIPAIIFVFSFSFVYDYFVYEIPIKSFIVNEENMHIETIPLILLIPALAIVVIIAIYNAELIYNILMYGNIAGPCVWVSDYISLGGDMADLTYDKDDNCYVK